jgi:hypothetical protein
LATTISSAPISWTREATGVGHGLASLASVRVPLRARVTLAPDLLGVVLSGETLRPLAKEVAQVAEATEQAAQAAVVAGPVPAPTGPSTVGDSQRVSGQLLGLLCGIGWPVAVLSPGSMPVRRQPGWRAACVPRLSWLATGRKRSGRHLSGRWRDRQSCRVTSHIMLVERYPSGRGWLKARTRWEEATAEFKGACAGAQVVATSSGVASLGPLDGVVTQSVLRATLAA